MKNFPPRLFFKVLCALIAVVATMAHAQTPAYPNKPIRLIIPAAAGGPTDTIGRLLGKTISDQFGVAVIVENRAGASGSIGVNAVVLAPADGYTLLVSTPDAVTVYPQVKKNAPYKTTDLTPITLLASTPYVFAVNAQSQANTMNEFVALSRTQKLAMATPGLGTSGHIVLEMLKQRSGIELLHVPYKGAGPAIQSIITAETHITVSSPVTLKGHIDNGKLRALAVSKSVRNPVLPNVPTMIQSGFPNFDVWAWFGLFAPPNLPPAIAQKLNEIVISAMKSPDYLSRIAALGLDVEPQSLGKFADMLSSETERWKQLIESAKITMDE